jgi:hypothetical protein
VHTDFLDHPVQPFNIKLSELPSYFQHQNVHVLLQTEQATKRIIEFMSRDFITGVDKHELLSAAGKLTAAVARASMNNLHIRYPIVIIHPIPVKSHE